METINTHDTSPSGNIHGMPLAASMGYGYENLLQYFLMKLKLNQKMFLY